MGIVKKHSKVFTGLFAMLIVGIIMLCVNVLADTSPKITVSNIENTAGKQVGDTVSVDINLENPGSKEFASLAVALDFDSDVLEVKNVDIPVELYKKFKNITDVSDASSVNFILTYIDGVTDYTGKLATVEFSIKEGASGKQEIGFGSKTDMITDAIENNKVNFNTENGYIFVNVPLESVDVINKNVTLDKSVEAGQNAKIEVAATPSNTTVDKNLSFTSNDTNVVTVDNEGNLTAVGTGNTTVSVSAYGESFTVNVTVNASLQSISLTNSKLDNKHMDLDKGDTQKINVIYNPSDTTDDKTITWESTKPNIVSVDSNGNIEAKTGGDATIVAKAKNGTVTDSISVHVDVPITSASLSDTNFTLARNSNKELSLTIEPDDATYDTIEWSTSDSSVLGIAVNNTNNKKATITGLKGGNATVTVKVGNKTLTANVEVNVPIEGVELRDGNEKVDGTTITMLPTQDKTLTTVITPEDYSGSKIVTWSVANGDAVTVSDGVIHATKSGEADVNATIQGVTKTVHVKVLIPVENMVISEETSTMLRNTEKELSVSFVPADAEEDKTITWSSSNPEAVSVTKKDATTATVKALKGAKDVVITASLANGKKVTSTITVNVGVDTFTVDKTKLDLDKGKTGKITATITPSDATYQDITWTSGDTSVATVDSTTGKVVTVTAKGKGDTTITGTLSDGKTVNVPVHVHVPITSVTITGTGVNDNLLSLNKGDNTVLSAVVGPNDTTEDKTVTWKSKNTNIATVDANGVVVAKAGGTTEITATAGNVTSTITVKVSVPIDSLTINKTTAEILRNKTTQLSVIVNPLDTTENKDIVWESEDTSIATVDQNGVVTGKKEGTVKITAKLKNNNRITPVECMVTVKIIPVDSISFAKDEITINKKVTSLLPLVINPENATEIGNMTWVSDNEEVVTVDEHGNVTGLKAGSATITVTMDKDFVTRANLLTATIKVNVQEIPLESLSIKNDLNTIKVGEMIDLEIIKNPIDTTDDVTFTYTSTDESVVKVTENGRLIAVGKGKATITVKASNGVEVSYPITVTGKESPATGVESIAAYGISSLALLGGIFMTYRKIRE